MDPEKERLRDSIVFEAFERCEADRAARIAFAGQRCGNDEDLLHAVCGELEAEEQLRRKAFLSGLEGSAYDEAIPRETPVGEYIIERLIGSGGMGSVYEAHQPRLRRTVAIKFLHARLAPNAKQRFLFEAQALSAVQSDRVVHVHTFGEHQGQPYIVMEYVPGTNLQAAIRNGPCGDLAARLVIARQIAEAVEDIHRAGMAHRDVKPSNVLIQPSGNVKLLDFGIAWRQDSQLTVAGQVVGTPAYMAPEQITKRIGSNSGRESDEYKRVDIYSLGVLMYELFTGTLPFEGETIAETEYKIVHQPLDVIPLLGAGVPNEVIRLISRAIAKDPAMRPESCAEIARVLSLQAAPITAATSRHRSAGVAGAVVLVAALAGVLLWREVPTQPARVMPQPTQPPRQDPLPGNPERSRTTAYPTIRANSIERPTATPKKAATPEPTPAGGSRSSAEVPPSIEFPDAPAVAATETPAAVLLPRTDPLPPPPTEAKHLAPPAPDWTVEWAELRRTCNADALRDFDRRHRADPVGGLAMNLANQCEARETARREVLSTLDAYRAAYSRRNLPELSTVMALSDEQRRRLRKSFSEASRIIMQIRPGPVEFQEPLSAEFAGPDFAPHTARVRIWKRIETVTNNGDTPEAERNETAVLKRTGQSWKITSFE
jgi:serine/threonine protein kinase